jgi:hypothetical protein
MDRLGQAVVRDRLPALGFDDPTRVLPAGVSDANKQSFYLDNAKKLYGRLMGGHSVPRWTSSAGDAKIPHHR